MSFQSHRLLKLLLSKEVRALIETSSREHLANQIRKITMLSVLRMEWGGGPGCLESQRREGGALNQCRRCRNCPCRCLLWHPHGSSVSSCITLKLAGERRLRHVEEVHGTGNKMSLQETDSDSYLFHHLGAL